MTLEWHLGGQAGVTLNSSFDHFFDGAKDMESHCRRPTGLSVPGSEALGPAPSP